MPEPIYRTNKPAETFVGNPCKKCGGTQRFVKTRYCVPCRRMYQNKTERSKTKDRREYMRNWYIFVTYGLSEDAYNNRLEKQNGVCAICFALPTTQQLRVDHDHNTGAVRGLLCAKCNQ